MKFMGPAYDLRATYHVEPGKVAGRALAPHLKMIVVGPPQEETRSWLTKNLTVAIFRLSAWRFLVGVRKPPAWRDR
jgi:hypothetical protein